MYKTDDKLSGFVAAHCRWLALVCLLSAVVPLYLLRDARIDNATEVWLGERNQARQDYRDFLNKYGNEEFVVLAGEADDPLSEDCLAFQKDLAERLRQIDNVDNVFTLATAAEILADFRSDWADLIRQNTLFRNFLIGADGRTFGMIVYLKEVDGAASRTAVIEGIEAAVATGGGPPIHMAGAPLLNVALDRGSTRTSQRFLPVAILLSVLILAVTLRGISPVIAVLSAVGVTTLWAMGILVASGRTLNMITVVMPSLLFMLSLSGGIHVTSRFLAHLSDETGPTETARRALTEVMRPVFLSNVTTALGFAALAISEMQPVVEFGIFTGIGILLSFVFNMTIVPGMLCLLHRGPGLPQLARPHWTAAVGEFVCRHRGPGLALALLVFLVSVGLTARARVESNVVQFFPIDSTLRRDYEFIGAHLTGMYTAEISVTTAAEQGSTMLKTLEELGNRIATRPEVAKVMHYRTIASCFKNVPIPVFLPSLAARKNPLKPMLHAYVHRADEQISLRLSVFIRRTANSEYYRLLDFIEEEASALIPAPATHYVTGIAPLSKAAQQSLIETQIRSFALAGGLILVIIGVFFRSWRALVAAILPNLLPIFSVFAVMTLLGIPFDTATVMIASIAIGIAADDTVHFLAHYQDEKRHSLATVTAVRNSLQKAGPAITYTSIVTAAGFVVLLLADFKPIQYFGLFTAVAMIAAWMGDVFVLPACVAILKLWEPGAVLDAPEQDTSIPKDNGKEPL